MWLGSRVVIVGMMAVSVAARADLRSEETEFGEYAYKAMRAIHDQTCTCVDDGNCKLKVSRAELRGHLERFNKGLEPMVPRLWPAIAKKMASLSTADAGAYGERLGQQHLDRLPRATVLNWARMMSTCWTISSEPLSAKYVDRARAALDAPTDTGLAAVAEPTTKPPTAIDEPPREVSSARGENLRDSQWAASLEAEGKASLAEKEREQEHDRQMLIWGVGGCFIIAALIAAWRLRR